MIGQKIGAYRLKRELGQGAFGVVYEADEEFDGRGFARVAVKVIHPRDAAHRASLVGELATLANFRHPNIVGYRAFGELPPEAEHALAPVYIALELAPGGTLTSKYGQQLFAPRQLLELARDVGEGLAFIARQGWTHRDIKPDNVLLFDQEAENIWKISDLGLARPTTAEDAPGGAAGTAHYMAPEAWRGIIAPANDVWALGLCLREAATGQRLWNSVSPRALPTLIGDEQMPLDVDVLPLCLREIVAGCLQHDPSQRWSAAQIVARARHELAQLPDETITALVVAESGGGTHTDLKNALREAPPGAHITLVPGRYDGPFVIERDIHLVGTNSLGNDVSEVIIESGAGSALTISGGRVTLEDLTLCGRASQSGQKFAVVTVNDAQVHFINCRISSDSQEGVVAGAESRVTLTDCCIEGIATEGVVAREGARMTLEGGRISKCGGNGLKALTGARLEARSLLVSGCGANGVHLGALAVAYLNGCQFTSNAHQGVRAANTTLARLENCEAQGNGYGAWEIPIGAEVTRVNTRPA